MDKYTAIHEKLATEFNIPSEAVSYIRRATYNLSWDREKAITYLKKRIVTQENNIQDLKRHLTSSKHEAHTSECTERMQQTIANIIKNVTFRQSILFFLQTISDEQFQEIAINE